MSNNNNNENNAFINWILTQDPSSIEYAQQQQSQQQSCSTLPPPPPANCQIPLTNPELLPYIMDGSTPSTTAPLTTSAPTPVPNTANYPLLPSTVPMDAPVPTKTISSSSAPSSHPNNSPIEDFKDAISFGAMNTTCSNHLDNPQQGDAKHQQQHHHRSDDDDDYLSESQLKMMTSKERRQLRNKISARKFRNRRKEYISMLEAEVQKQKAENNQLRLEVTWIRTTADKLQKENDQLRLNLALCEKGIKSPEPNESNSKDQDDVGQINNNNKNSTNIMPASHTVPSSNRSASSLSPPSLGNSSFNDTGSNGSTSDCSSTSSNNNPSPPELTDQWELVFNDNQLIQYPPVPPQQQQQQQQPQLQQQLQLQLQPQPQALQPLLPQQQVQQHHPQQYQYYPYHNTYLSHAAIPDWDLSTILKKEQDQSTPANDLFYKYPLLAPALMSIVLGHTMTMTTQDLVANTKLLPPPSDPLFMPTVDELPRFLANDLFFGPKIRHSTNSTTNKKLGILTGEEFRSMWEAQQFHMDSLDDWHPEDEEEEDEKDKIKYIRLYRKDSRLPEYCPLNWLQRQFCRFVYDYVIARYPDLEAPAQHYLPLCDKFRRQQMMITMD